MWLDLAELAKKDNLLADARRLFARVQRARPGASAGWLEHAKLEEECGHAERSLQLLLQGLLHCGHNDGLLAKVRPPPRWPAALARPPPR